MMASIRTATLVEVADMAMADYPSVRSIYLEGILTGNSTFETEPPSWELWNQNHLPFGRLVARSGQRVVGWAALSPVSTRICYAGVAEVSLYVAQRVHRNGIGRALMAKLIRASEANGLWTLQGSIFPENHASLRLCERSGFRQVGQRKHIAKLDGLWRDTVLVERRSSVVGLS